MFTDNYKNMLEKVIDKIHNDKLNYKNSIIVGDNSSGKSEVLKSLTTLSTEKYYFIDAINRTFDISKVSNTQFSYSCSYENISEYRIKENIFNLNDSFDIYGDGTGHIEYMFYTYIDELKVLIKKFLDVEIAVEEVKYGVFSAEEKITINGEIDKLSNGYQAIMRLFLEMLYIQNYKDNHEVTIIIDEIDEYLSPKNKSKIIYFLQQEFPDFKWIVTTHSADVIASTEDFNLIVLNKGNYECLDSNDFRTITDVQEIFRELYDKQIDTDISNINSTLRRLLSLKISDKWSEQEEKDLAEITNKNLTNTQLLILKQIQSW